MFSYTYPRLLLYMGRVREGPGALGLLKTFLTCFYQLITYEHDSVVSFHRIASKLNTYVHLNIV